MKGLLSKKAPGFYVTLLTLILAIAGMIFFNLLSSTAVEQSETPALVFAASAATAVLCIVAAVKDFFKVPSWAAFVAATIAFFVFVSGRVSYVAFYLSGDVMGTGLSAYFIPSAVCFLLMMVFAAAAMCLKQEK